MTKIFPTGDSTSTPGKPYKNTKALDIFFAKSNILKKKHYGKVIIMLKKFSVENFKGFRDRITLDIGNPSNYGFHPEVIENGCITKRIIYGINGLCKSNLGLAIFDVITLVIMPGPPAFLHCF